MLKIMPNISISNIAWDTENDLTVAEFLASSGVKQIDIAPSKYFQDLDNIRSLDVSSLIQFWGRYDISIVGMQSLFFALPDINLFSGTEHVDFMRRRFRKLCTLGEELGGVKLVFGSPKNRIIGNIHYNIAFDLACKFFNEVGDFAYNSGCQVCLETNPVEYGGDFMVTPEETAKVVSHVNNQGIKMQLDTGAMLMTEDFRLFDDIVGHIHLSEPWLKPLSIVNSEKQKLLLKGIRDSDFIKDNPVTIEILTPEDAGESLEAITKSIALSIDWLP